MGLFLGFAFGVVKLAFHVVRVAVHHGLDAFSVQDLHQTEIFRRRHRPKRPELGITEPLVHRRPTGEAVFDGVRIETDAGVFGSEHVGQPLQPRLVLSVGPVDRLLFKLGQRPDGD